MSTEKLRTGYISNPRTLEEHLHNCRFQLENIEGWLALGANHPGKASAGVESAAVKANCLLSDVKALVEALHKERASS